MFFNYLKTAWRNAKRFKIYSLINVTGFAIGLVISLVIGFYVFDDLTYDRFHEHAGDIYRVLTIEISGGQEAQTYSITSGPLILAVKEEIPEVVGATRTYSFGTVQVRRQEAGEEEGIGAFSLVTDHGFFDVFDFKILAGDPSQALTTPNGVLLTPELAATLFPEDDPVGESIQVNFIDGAYVAGIVEAPPSNSHIQYQILLPLRVEQNPVWWDSWENLMLSGYIRIQEGADPANVQEKMVEVARKNNFAEIYNPRLQPLRDVHLGSAHHQYDFSNRGKNDASVVYSLCLIGTMILLIASINFINLSSARAMQRAREVGLRKVVGSRRAQLIGQFLGETICMTVAAMAIAMVILQIVASDLENFVGKRLDIDFVENPALIAIFLGIAVLVGLLAGIYPSLLLSSFRPITVLRGEFRSSRAGVLLRRILVVCQFAITIALIVGVFTVMVQINYIKSRDMGYNRQQVLVIPSNVNNGEDLLKSSLKSLPSVVSLGRVALLPGAVFTRYEVMPEGFERTKSHMFQLLQIDEGFFSTLEIDLLHGRNFSAEFQSDAEDAVIINAHAMRLAGWTEPIGKRLDIVDLDGSIIHKHIIGVIEDLHFSNARQGMEPMMFFYTPRGRFLLARLASGDIVGTVKNIEELHGGLYPDVPFNSVFLDDVFDQQFNQDRQFARSLGFFSSIAVLIACLGLLGLVSFAVEQRRREIAVRKVIGCREGKIVMLLAVDLLKWVLIANCIAWPLGYFGMQVWLRGFVYRVPLTLWPFFVAGAGALLIALLTISFQAIRAARTNPAEVLRKDM